MAAKFATVDEHVLAHTRGSDDIRDAVVASSGANKRLRDCVLQFDCGYLSPFFIH